MEPVILDGRTLTPADLHRVAGGAPVRLAEDARAAMRATSPYDGPIIAEKWQWLLGGAPPERGPERIRAFVLSHCAGVGPPLPSGLVRATMAARANVLAVGLSGCRPEIADLLVSMLDHEVTPDVPSQGCVGTAGSPVLAAIAAVALGFGGSATRAGHRATGAAAMEGIIVPTATEKEALALLNGSTFTVAAAAIAVARARRLLDTAIRAAALSFEVCRADLGCLSDAALSARGHRGGIDVARRLREHLAGSGLVGLDRTPDPFSIRCAPAVLGAAAGALDAVEDIVRTELNGACDNPLVFPDGTVVEAGNFHAAPVALALDHLKVAMTQVASIAERRIYRMTYGQLSGLPSYLVESTGLNSGLMLAQYTAASRVSEMKGLAHPASVDSLPTIQHREDHASMGPVAALATLELLECVADVLAIELMCGAQGADLQLERVAGATLGCGSQAAYNTVRARVSRWDDDRVLHPDLARLTAAVRDGALVDDPTPW